MDGEAAEFCGEHGWRCLHDRYSDGSSSGSERGTVPSQISHEDDENAPATEGMKGPSKTKAIIGALAAGALAVGAIGLLVLIAKRHNGIEDIEAEESPTSRTLTSSEREFDAIVHDVAAGFGRITSVYTNGFGVVAKFRTGSGKGSWTAYFTFDEETGHYTWSCPHRSAGSPWAFGDEVAQRIREAAAN